MRPDRFIAELRRRRVFRVTAWYAAAAFVVLQLGDLVIDPLGLPDGTMTLLILLSGAGLVITLVLAWLFDITPDGLERTDAESSSAMEPVSSARARSRSLVLGIVAVLVIGTVVFTAYLRGRDEPISSIAVLPFANLTRDEGNAYFSDGIQEDILTQLAKVEGLKVISRGSVQRYREGSRDMRRIGRELGVEALLEGSVRRDGQQVRVNARLVDARTEGQLWAERYDRELTDVFAIQSDIAQHIVAALRTELTQAEQRRIDRKPTTQPEAYLLLLRARSLGTFSGNAARPFYAGEASREAERLLQQAIAIDPEYADAHAALAHLYQWRCFTAGTELQDSALRVADRALELAPDLGEAFAAKGHVLWLCQRRYQDALVWLTGALERMPNDADVTQSIGAIFRSQGRWDEGARMLARSAELNPMAPDYHYHAGRTYAWIEQYGEAERFFRQSLLIDPEYVPSLIELGDMYLDATGRLDSLRVAIGRGGGIRAPETDAATYATVLTAARYRLALYEGDYRSALEVLDSTTATRGRGWSATLRPLEQAFVWELLGDSARARRYAEIARATLEDSLTIDPDDANVHSMLGRAYAFLGAIERAHEHGHRGVELFPQPMNRDGSERALDLAWILARTGAREDAVRVLQRHAATPAGVTRHRLRLDPRWISLRATPAFRRLVGEPD